CESNGGHAQRPGPRHAGLSQDATWRRRTGDNVCGGGGPAVSTAPVTCQQLAAEVQRRKRSAREIADEALAKAARFQDKFRTFIRMTPEIAQGQARRVDERVKAGEKLPLAGVPFAVKDVFDVQNVPTTFGSKAFADRIAKADGTAVKKLVAAGGVCL